MSKRVPLNLRILDALGLLLLVGGGALYAWAWLGLRGMDAFQRPEGAPMFAAVARTESLDRLSTVGMVMIIVGACVALFATVLHMRTRRAAHH